MLAHPSIVAAAEVALATADLDRHRRLIAYYAERLRPRLPPGFDDDGAVTTDETGGEESLLMERVAERFVREARASIAERAAAAPRDPDGFVRWFEDLREHGPGQGDVLFPWLAEEATLEQLRWFLRQEVAGEAGFEDLLAITQVRFPERAKLEMARNFWDELGRGHAVGMHGPMLARLARALDVVTPVEDIAVEPLALGNLMLAMASKRHYAYHSVGALGVIELTAPGRSAAVNQGLARVGIEARERQYFALHATLDKQHSIEWNKEVLWSLVDENPATARALAEGALVRLSAGARCFDRYRRELGVGACTRPGCN